MSTHTCPIVFVGQTFEGYLDALNFIKDHNLLTSEEYKDIIDKINSNYCNLEECLNEKFKIFPSSEILNSVTGTGYFLGYTVAAYKTETDMFGFLKDIQIAQENWHKIFNEDGIVCIEVQTS